MDGSPAAQNADGGARHAPALGSCDGAWQLRAREPPCAAQFAHGKMHVFPGVLPRCLALGDPAVGGFFSGALLCKSGGWR